MGSHKKKARPVFESKEASLGGRDRGIGSSEEPEKLPPAERETGNPVAGGDFLSLADDAPTSETSLPASEADDLRHEERSP